MSRRRARELALQVLFQVDVVRANPERALEYLLAEHQVSDETAAFARLLVKGTLAKIQEIDDYIKRYAIEWDLPRMANVDRNILRLGLFEMLYYGKTPLNVAIDEAVELAKTFSEENSCRFINGILGRIAREVPLNPGT